MGLVRPELAVRRQGQTHLLLPGQCVPVRDMRRRLALIDSLRYSISGIVVDKTDVCAVGMKVPVETVREAMDNQDLFHELEAFEAASDVGGRMTYRLDGHGPFSPGCWPSSCINERGGRPFIGYDNLSVPEAWRDVHNFGLAETPFPRPFFGVEQADGLHKAWHIGRAETISIRKLRVPFEAYAFEMRSRYTADYCRFAAKFQEFCDNQHLGEVLLILPGTPVPEHADLHDQRGRQAYSINLHPQPGKMRVFLEGGNPLADHDACLHGRWWDDRVHKTRPPRREDPTELPPPLPTVRQPFGEFRTFERTEDPKAVSEHEHELFGAAS